MKRVYHLDLTKGMIRGATVALLPGDPARAGLLAGAVSEMYGGRAGEIAFNREFCTYLSEMERGKVLVTSTGIGGPSASIAVEELATLGVTTFIRVGTTGAIQPGIRTGDVVVTTAAVRLDGASRHYAPIEYPAVADHGIVCALIEGARGAGVRYHVGISASSDTFYPGEERDDSFRRYVIRELRGSAEEWLNLGVLNYEMEAATILTMTASMGLRGGCITGVVNRAGTGGITERNLRLGERNVVRAAVASLGSILDAVG